MFAKIKAACLNSLTIAWGYFLALAGALMQGLDVIVDLLGGQDFKDQLTAAIGDAKLVGRILLGISIVTILARIRSIRKAV